MPKLPDSGFDAVAPFYDALAKLVFGNSLQKAQLATLPAIPKGASVLVVGGGSGWILEQLLSQANCSAILYLEASPKMLKLAEKKLAGLQPLTKVTLRLGTEHNLGSEEKFDVIITHFLLDLFAEKRLQAIIRKLNASLKPGGIWLASDFRFVSEKQVWWQKALLQSMYRFFRLTSGIEAKTLPNWDKLLQQNGLRKIKSDYFYKQMIEAAVYQKDDKAALA